MSDRLAKSTQSYLSSEAYRAMLVRDGERRLREWHTAFLDCQKLFVAEMAQRRQR